MKKLVHTPDGVRDIYAEEEQRKLKIEQLIKDTVYSYGYEDIQTPTFEYFDVFSNDIGTTPSRELYKFFDKDGDTLVLRPDFTPSVARCVAKYFSDEKNPIRLTYMGNTFINNLSLQGKLKEVTQIGCELMNDDSAAADAEMIHLVIDTLKASGLKRFQIVVGQMEYFKGLCEQAGINEEDEMTLRELISSKNHFSAKDKIEALNISDNLKNVLLKTGELFGSIDVIEDMKAKVNNPRSLNALNRLTEVYDILKVYGDEDYVSFDLGILSKYNYYTGVIFKAYTYGIGDVLVKGGRYDNLLESFGTSKPAIGFMVVIDDLMMALRGQNISVDVRPVADTIYYNDSNLLEKIKEAGELRKSGKAVKLIHE